MSSAATPSTAPGTRGQATPAPARGGARLPSGDLVAGLAIAAAIVALAMITAGAVDNTTASSGNTWTEIAVTVLGAGCVCAALTSTPRRRWGLAAVGMLAVVTALQAISIAWSWAPDSSWLASNQAVSYFAAFTGAVCLAWLAPARWRALLGGFALAMTVLCGWSLLVKVFPATLAPNNTTGRLEAPFGYWNAIGLCAAIGMPACLWFGSRRGEGRTIAGLAAPALCLMLSVLILSYSRSADAAGAAALALWLIFAPVRLRSLALLAVGAAGAAVIGAWMLTHDALNRDGVAAAAQDHAGHTFGIVIAVVLFGVTVAGLVVARAADRISLPDNWRRRIGGTLIALVALGVLAAIGAVAISSRGLTGEISHGWHQLTATNAVVSASSASRVFAFGSSRPVYWHEAIHVGEHALLKGVGALGFGVARLRYATGAGVVSEAHSYVFETFADLGLIGVVAIFALLFAWLSAAARPLAIRVRSSALSPERAAERNGMIALATIVVAFGIQSTLDWTWYFAGVTVPVLVCAGWLAGRGSLLGDAGGASEQADAQRSSTGVIDRLASRPAAAAGIVLVVVCTLAVAWLQWRPLHSAQELDRSVNSKSTAQAFTSARAARASDPLSLAPRFRLADLYAAIDDPAAARLELVMSTQLQPENPMSWNTLGYFDLVHGNVPGALKEFERALELDQTSDTNHLAARVGAAQARKMLAAPPPSASGSSG